MTINRRAAKRDKNESEIIQALRAAGAVVAPISGKGVPDLLVGHRGAVYLAECKGKHGRLTPAQDKFHSEWTGGKIFILRSVEDAIAMISGTDEV